MNNPKALALVTIVFWSFGTYLARLISIKSQFVLLGLSFLFTFLTLLVFFGISEFRNPSGYTLHRLKPSYFVFGMFGYFVYGVSLNQSFRAFDSASEATLLNYTWPLFTVVFTLAFFQRRANRFRLMEGIGIATGFLAVVILATEGDVSSLDLTNISGILWGLAAGMSYGLFSGYSSTVPQSENTLFLLAASFVSFVLMFVLAFSELGVVNDLGVKDIIVAALLGCILDGIGYITWTRANRLAHEKRISISSVASIMFALPLLSLLIITVFLGEKQLMRPFFVISLLLIILSSVICQKSSNMPDGCSNDEST